MALFFFFLLFVAKTMNSFSHPVMKLNVSFLKNHFSDLLLARTIFTAFLKTEHICICTCGRGWREFGENIKVKEDVETGEFYTGVLSKKKFDDKVGVRQKKIIKAMVNNKKMLSK